MNLLYAANRIIEADMEKQAALRRVVTGLAEKGKDLAHSVAEKGKDLAHSVAESTLAAGNKVSDAAAYTMDRLFRYKPQNTEYKDHVLSIFDNYFPEEVVNAIKATPGKLSSISELPKHLYNTIAKVELPKRFNYAKDFDYKNLTPENAQNIMEDLDLIARSNPNLAAVYYQKFRKLGLKPEQITTALKEHPTTFFGESRVFDPNLEPTYATVTERISAKLAEKAHAALDRIGEKTTAMYRPIEEKQQAIERKALEAYRKVYKHLLNTEPRSLDMIHKLRQSIIEDTRSPVKEFIQNPEFTKERPFAAISIFNPGAIQTGPITRSSLATLAHEYGHSMRPTTWLGRWANRRYLKYSKLLDIDNPINNLLYKVPEEVRASWNGYKKLRELNVPKLQALRAFLGVPDYAIPGMLRMVGL